MRVIGYLQMRAVGAVVEGPGFVAQEQHLHEWAQRHGHDVVRLVADRWSADTPGSGLSGAVAAVQAGEADALLVTSRERLGAQHAPGVTVLFANQPDGVGALTRPRRRARGHLRSALGPLVGIAVATAVAAGVATASVEGPSGLKGTCVSVTFETVPCDGKAVAKVVDVVLAPEHCVVGDEEYPRPDGIRLCLGFR